MSKNTKIIIGVIAGILVLCGIACVVGVVAFGWLGTKVASNVSVDSENAGEKQADIATIDMPARFTPATSFNLASFTMVLYESSNTDEFAALIQMPNKGEIDDTIIQQLQEGMQRSSNRSYANVEVIETRDMTIRGYPAKVIIQEGTDDNGDTGRMMLTAFQGKGGVAMLMIGAPLNSYNQADYDAIVESIR